ncbi:hypothetical protein FRACA_60028 [Frankia canadensis]|uniref:Uncharacterized protein n=1 Tax=Frankia canadensis TaxID=1836972 RepID=A0A2I2KZE3_9ACTN|nr:hypothetical protein FRACA_60028 [Frankia canadensis]SOU58332.1 hypothetical protein FRACA_60028 [Frankia canadensis]
MFKTRQTGLERITGSRANQPVPAGRRPDDLFMHDASMLRRRSAERGDDVPGAISAMVGSNRARRPEAHETYRGPGRYGWATSTGRNPFPVAPIAFESPSEGPDHRGLRETTA